jgi:hypothetical protein
LVSLLSLSPGRERAGDVVLCEARERANDERVGTTRRRSAW